MCRCLTLLTRCRTFRTARAILSAASVLATVWAFLPSISSVLVSFPSPRQAFRDRPCSLILATQPPNTLINSVTHQPISPSQYPLQLTIQAYDGLRFNSGAVSNHMHCRQLYGHGTHQSQLLRWMQPVAVPAWLCLLVWSAGLQVPVCQRRLGTSLPGRLLRYGRPALRMRRRLREHQHQLQVPMPCWTDRRQLRHCH